MVPLALVTALFAVPTSGSAAPGTGDDSVVRSQIDLRGGWGNSRACDVSAAGVRCYRSEAAMDRALGLQTTPISASQCSGSLRLYDGVSYGGTVLSLRTRGTLIALANYGFNNRTSSYKVGPCASRLYNGIGTSRYPGNTSAGARAPRMLSGWNNVISSVLIT